MRIGIDARMYGTTVTGIGRYVQCLTDELFRLPTTDEYFVLLLPEAFAKFHPPHSRVHPIRVTSHWYTLDEQITLAKVINRLPLDVLHVPHFNAPLWCRHPLVVTIHDITPKFFPGPLARRFWLRRQAYSLVLRGALTNSRRIIVDSQHVAKLLESHYRVNQAKVDLVPIGISPAFHDMAKYGIVQTLRQRFSIDGDYLFYSGVWRDHKNLPALVEAFRILRIEQRRPLTLVLGGEAREHHPELVQAWEAAEIADAIVTPGFIPDHEMPAWYHGAQLTVVPSFAEGFGLLAVESVACGTAVVASNTTSIPEVLGDGVATFNPHQPRQLAEVIAHLLDHPDQRDELLHKARLRLPRYRWDACAAATYAVYRRVIG